MLRRPGRPSPGHGHPARQAGAPRRTRGKPEVVALGLRNPWRFSFDRATGDLYVGDVGAGKWEEVDYLPRAEVGNLVNFGWDVWEASEIKEDKPPNPAGRLVFPVHAYSHDGHCSITGGFVYRGSVAELRGRYFFGTTAAARCGACASTAARRRTCGASRSPSRRFRPSARTREESSTRSRSADASTSSSPAPPEPTGTAGAGADQGTTVGALPAPTPQRPDMAGNDEFSTVRPALRNTDPQMNAAAWITITPVCVPTCSPKTSDAGLRARHRPSRCARAGRHGHDGAAPVGGRPRSPPQSAERAGLRPRRGSTSSSTPPALRPLRRQPPLRRQADLRRASGA